MVQCETPLRLLVLPRKTNECPFKHSKHCRVSAPFEQLHFPPTPLGLPLEETQTTTGCSPFTLRSIYVPRQWRAPLPCIHDECFPSNLSPTAQSPLCPTLSCAWTVAKVLPWQPCIPIHLFHVSLLIHRTVLNINDISKMSRTLY